MNTRKHLLAVSVFLTIATLTTITAQAFSFKDLFKSKDAQAEQGPSCSSLDCMLASISNQVGESEEQIVMNETTMTAAVSPVGKTGVTTRRSYTVQVSGYNSEVAQTDDSPFIGAAGTYVRDGTVAANIINAYGGNIPLFTVIRFKNCAGIPNDKVFSVEDRLNKRYTKNVDIWFEHKADALKFGRRTCQIEVL